MNRHHAPFQGAQERSPRKAGATVRIAVLSLLLGSLGSLSAGATEMRVLAVQPARTLESSQPFAPGIDRSRRLQLTTATRRFDLALEPNTELVAEGRIGETEALRGNLPGLSRSWARLTRRNGQYRGLYSDGVELFVVETAGALAASNAQAAALPADTPVVYRLADLQIRGPVMEGDTRTTLRSGSATLAMVGAEFATAAATAVLTTKRLDVGVLADTELVALDGTATDGKALDRLNVVDGIFSSQVGVQIRLAGVAHVSSSGDSLASTDSSTLIDQLASYRLRTAAQQANGVTHLLTGRDLDGTTVGIAYLSSLCSRQYSASLSEARTSVAFDGLIAAHEMGHVFGAPHDGETTAACAATPDNQFLMAPRMNSSSTFSDCSLQQIAPTVSAASCLAQLSAPDAALSVAGSNPLVLNQATAASFTVASVGNATVNGVMVTITPPAGVTVNSGTLTGGSCAASGATLRCTVGDLAAGARRDVLLSLTGTVSGSSTATLQLTATNDGLTTNNRSALTLVTAPGADLTVSLSGDGTQVTVGQSATLRATLQNRGLANAPDATVVFTLPAGATVTAVTGTGLACSLTGSAVACPAFALAANAQATLDITVRADQVGSLVVSASFSSPTLQDPITTNNSATATLTGIAAPVVTPPISTTPTSSGGGGGSGGALALLAALLGAARRARRLARYWPVLEK